MPILADNCSFPEAKLRETTNEWCAEGSKETFAPSWIREEVAPYHRECRGQQRRLRPIRAIAAVDPWDRLPQSLKDLRQVIEASKRMLDLEEGWDGSDARRIKPDTWRHAATFVAQQAEFLWMASGKIVASPSITPVPDGSVDIHWDQPSLELLINVPVDQNTPADFYGDDRGRLSIKGTFDLSTFSEGIVHWLIKTV